MFFTPSIAVLISVSFVSGILVGYVLRGMLDGKMQSKPSDFVLVIVLTIWAITRLVDLISPDITTPLALDGLVGAIVGFFYRPIKSQ